jgi:AraC family transcriptional regulator, melibiose operon regulatory protein
MTTFDSSRPDFAPYGFTCIRWTPTRMSRPDRHNEIELNLLQTGSLSYIFGGRKVIIEAGRLAVFWAAIPHQVVSADNNPEYYVATIPLAWFLQWNIPQYLVHSVLHGRIEFDPMPDQTDLDKRFLERWIEDLASGQAELRRAALLEIEARLVRMATALPACHTEQVDNRTHGSILSEGGLSKAEQMSAYIARHYTELLTVEKISQSVGLHPNYAMAVFRKAFGGTMIDFVTQHRLSHAQLLLITTDNTILSVSLDAGFGSISHFNEMFKKSFGCTPRQYRQYHRIAN